MRSRDPTVWMWSEALAVLDRADRMQRQCFQLAAQRHACPTWEPPADIVETESQFILLVALPGVEPERVRIGLEGSVVIVRGQRPMPDMGQSARIHRIEIPLGHFERRIELPIGQLRQLRVGNRVLVDGCLTLTLDKLTP